MIPFAGAAAVEAVETDVQAGRVVLENESHYCCPFKSVLCSGTYYGVKTLSAILSVH